VKPPQADSLRQALDSARSHMHHHRYDSALSSVVRAMILAENLASERDDLERRLLRVLEEIGRLRGSPGSSLATPNHVAELPDGTSAWVGTPTKDGREP
jgi:hypothetical protein